MACSFGINKIGFLKKPLFQNLLKTFLQSLIVVKNTCFPKEETGKKTKRIRNNNQSNTVESPGEVLPRILDRGVP